MLQNLIYTNKEIAGTSLSKFERKHHTIGGNALRAAVLGGNDGLLSNFSLVMGVAGATNGQKEVMLAGIAGLLAGAFSMALGEWISVKSSQELYENQMDIELSELELNPEGEQREIELIYAAKGVNEAESKRLAKEIIQNKDLAHQFLIKEELGINEDELSGSAIEAALTSFILFAVGAIIPLMPFIFLTGLKAIIVCVIVSAIGLFFIGAFITLFTNKNIFYSGFRQVLFGIIAAAITFGIGKWIGVSLS